MNRNVHVVHDEDGTYLYSILIRLRLHHTTADMIKESRVENGTKQPGLKRIIPVSVEYSSSYMSVQMRQTYSKIEHGTNSFN